MAAKRVTAIAVFSLAIIGSCIGAWFMLSSPQGMPSLPSVAPTKLSSHHYDSTKLIKQALALLESKFHLHCHDLKTSFPSIEHSEVEKHHKNHVVTFTFSSGAVAEVTIKKHGHHSLSIHHGDGTEIDSETNSMCDIASSPGGAVADIEVGEDLMLFALDAINSHRQQACEEGLDCCTEVFIVDGSEATNAESEIFEHEVKIFTLELYEEGFEDDSLFITVDITEILVHDEVVWEWTISHPDPCSVTNQHHDPPPFVGLDGGNSEDRLLAREQKLQDLTDVARHNHQFKKGEVSWKATPVHRQKHPQVYGVPIDQSPADDAILEAEDIMPLASIPASYDFRRDHPDCVMEAVGQGSCGSCWAFAGSGAFEKQVCKATDAGLKPRMSRQQCVECGIDSGACAGGFPSSCYTHYAREGGIEDECNEYTSGRTLTPKGPSPLGSAYCRDRDCTKFRSRKPPGSTAYRYEGTKTARLYDEDAMKAAIYKYGAISSCYIVYKDFSHYTNGVYRPNPRSGERGGHAIQLIGWGVENGVKYWIGENSWGSQWGETKSGQECGSQVCNGDWCVLAADYDCGYLRFERGSDAATIESWAPQVTEFDIDSFEEDINHPDDNDVDYSVVVSKSPVHPDETIEIVWTAPTSRKSSDYIFLQNTDDSDDTHWQYVNNGDNDADTSGQNEFTGVGEGVYDVYYAEWSGSGDPKSKILLEGGLEVSAAHREEEEKPDSCEHPTDIGDGYCDERSNNADCNWDGGDCCEDTCVDAKYECGVVEYDCKDQGSFENDGNVCFLRSRHAAVKGCNDKVEGVVGSAGECEYRCLQDEQCQSFDYNRVSTKCNLSYNTYWTMDECGGEWSASDESEWDYYQKQDMPKCFKAHTGYAIIGYNDAVHSASSIEECATLCEMDLSCRLLEFNEAKKKCQLSYKSIADLAEEDPDAYAEYDDWTLAEIGCSYWDKAEGHAIKGSNQGGSLEGTVEECQQACLDDVDCLSFDYKKATGTCYLSYDDKESAGDNFMSYSGFDYYEFTCHHG